MPHLSKLSLTNFRIFDDETTFSLSPITILTGTNNSGKSSLIKSLQLLKENFTNIETFSDLNLEFFDAGHRLGSCTSVLNDASKNLTFKFPCWMPGLPTELCAELNYKKSATGQDALLNRILITYTENDKNIKVLEYCNEKKKSEGNNTGVDDRYINIEFFIDYYIKPVKNIIINSRIIEKIENRAPAAFYVWREDEYEVTAFLSEMANNIGINFNKLPIENSLLKMIKILEGYGHFIEEFEYNIPFMFSNFILNQFLRKNKLTEEELGEFLKTQKEENSEAFLNNLRVFLGYTKRTWSKLLHEHNHRISLLPESAIQLMAADISLNQQGNIINTIRDDIMFNITGSEPWTPIKIKISDLEGLIIPMGKIQENWVQKLLPSSSISEIKFSHLIAEICAYTISSIQESLKTTDFLSAARAEVKRSYLAGQHSSTFENQIYEFLKFPLDDKASKFLSKWTQKFELGELKIENLTGNLTTVTLDGRQLSDLGYGIGQLISILLKIISLYAQQDHRIYKRQYHKIMTSFPSVYRFMYSTTLVIEEPETNLHPKFQSMIADLLLDANLEFDMQFIIETHSEYLIRKLQYLTSAGQIKPNDLQIYYFNKATGTKGKKIKKINIRDDGSLTDDFGTGFIDEADNLSIMLFDCTRKSLN